MFKVLFAAFAILILSGCTQIQNTFFAPSDIEIYCRKIFNSPDKNEALYTCIRQERDAKYTLSRMKIPPEIEKHCRQLSASTGGSYQVMLTCVQSEIRSRNR